MSSKKNNNRKEISRIEAQSNGYVKGCFKIFHHQFSCCMRREIARIDELDKMILFYIDERNAANWIHAGKICGPDETRPYRSTILEFAINFYKVNDSLFRQLQKTVWRGKRRFQPTRIFIREEQLLDTMQWIAQLFYYVEYPESFDKVPNPRHTSFYFDLDYPVAKTIWTEYAWNTTHANMYRPVVISHIQEGHYGIDYSSIRRDLRGNKII